MKKTIILGLILAGSAAIGYWGWQHRPREIPDVLILYGNIDLREVDLAVNGSERLARVLVWEGDRVERGQLLAELELERFHAQVDQLKAQVAAQQALVEKLENGSRPQEIRLARDQMEEAKAQETITWLTYQSRAAVLRL